MHYTHIILLLYFCLPNGVSVWISIFPVFFIFFFVHPNESNVLTRLIATRKKKKTITLSQKAVNKRVWIAWNQANENMKLIICETVSVHRFPINFLLHLFLASGVPVRVRYTLYSTLLVVVGAAVIIVVIVIVIFLLLPLLFFSSSSFSYWCVLRVFFCVCPFSLCEILICKYLITQENKF